MEFVKLILFRQPNGIDGLLGDLDAEEKNAFLYEVYKVYPSMFEDQTDVMTSDFMKEWNSNKEFFFMLKYNDKYFAYDKYAQDNLNFRTNPYFHEMIEYYKSFFSMNHLVIDYVEIEKNLLLNNYIINFCDDTCEESLIKKP